MADPILPLSQEDLFNFIRNGVAPSPQEVYSLMLTNFSDENQNIINSPGNPFGTLLLTSAVATSAVLGQVIELNSNLLFTDSQGEQLRKNLFNFGTEFIAATSTVVRVGFDIDTQVTIAAGTIWEDELNIKYQNIVPFNSTDATGEIDLFSVPLGALTPNGTPVPLTNISALSNFSTVSITTGRTAETDEDIKTRLENAEGAKIFGTSTFVETALLQQINFVLSASVTQNNTSSPVTIQNVSVDANSIVSIVRSLVDPQSSIAAIGSTIFESIKSAQKLSQPPILGGTLPAVEFSSGYADEAALNAAGYETDPLSDWSVWSPDQFSGVVNITWINAVNQDIEIIYNVTFVDTISVDQRNALINELKVISLVQTPIFSQTFSRINITQYSNVIAAAIDDGSITIVSIFLSVKGDAGQQNKQSIVSDLNKFLNLDGEIVNGTAITDDVTVNEV